MENLSSITSSYNAHMQLSSFVSLDADDEMAQLILEEISYMRRNSFTGVAAEIASSPSSASATGLNAISEDNEEEE